MDKERLTIKAETCIKITENKLNMEMRKRVKTPLLIPPLKSESNKSIALVCFIKSVLAHSFMRPLDDAPMFNTP